MISSVGAFFCRNLSYCLLRTSRPSVWGILGHSPTTSAVTRITLSGTSPKSLSLSRKSAVSFMYDFPSYVNGAANNGLRIPQLFLWGYYSLK